MSAAAPSLPASTGSDSLRERNKERTRRALREVGIKLFVEQGFDTVTVDQIVAAAGVSQRTFFRYFPCKEAVLFGSEFADAVLEELRRRPTNEPLVASLRAATAIVAPRSVDTWHQRRRLRQALLPTHPSVRAYARQLIDEQSTAITAVIAQRLGVDPLLDPRPFVAGQLWGALSQWLLRAGDLGSDPIAPIDEFFTTMRHLLVSYRPTAR